MTSKWFKDMSDDERDELAGECIDWAMNLHVDWDSPLSDMEQALEWYCEENFVIFEDKDDLLEWLENEALTR